MTTDLTPPSPARRHRAILSLGSNLGDRLTMLQGAVDTVGETPGVKVVAVSPVYETGALGVTDQPDYLNAVVVITTSLPSKLLLERVRAVENAFGRRRRERWSARTLDVDILTYDDERSDDPELTLPHPRAHERGFVLAPLHDVDPDAELPGCGRVADLLERVRDQDVRRRDDLELRSPA